MPAISRWYLNHNTSRVSTCCGSTGMHATGHFDEPQCVQVCPVACIPVDPQQVETREVLWFKYQRLIAGTAA